MRLWRDEIRRAKLNTRSAGCHAGVPEAGRQISPDFAAGAKLFVPITADHFCELELSLKVEGDSSIKFNVF